MSVGRAGAPGRGGPAGCGWNRMMQPCASTLAPAGVCGHLSRVSGTPSPSSSPGWARTTSFDTGHPVASTVVPAGVLGHLSSESGTPSPSESLPIGQPVRSEEHTSELQSQSNLVCRLLLEKKKENTLKSL